MKTVRSLACICAAVLLCATILAGEEAKKPDDKEKKPAEKKIAVQFNFNGVFTEEAGDNDDPFTLFTAQAGQSGLRDLIKRVEAAAASERVAGVFLSIEQPLLTREQSQELREALAKVRKAGKPVLAFAEMLDNDSYLLAAAADRVYISPGGMVLLKGLFLRQWFMKGTLDKLGIQADLLQVGAYKGAAESLTLAAPSKQTQEMLTWLIDDWFEQLAEELGRSRHKDAEAAKIRQIGRAWLNEGPYTARQAVALGIIDGIKNRTDVIAELKTLSNLGENEKLELTFGEKKRPSIDFGNPFAIFKLFATGAPKSETSTQPVIGVIHASGVIDSGQSSEGGLFGSKIGSTSVVATIEKARKDKAIKAVVLRLDSPGGSAIASEVINAALKRLKADKPVIVSMGTLAASGGYYISAPADRIFAHPTSLVGSIGVFGGKMVLKGVYDWIGMTSHAYSRGGEKVAIEDEVTPFNAAEKNWVLSSMNEVYDMFVKAVKEGRGAKLVNFESHITGGKVFTGRQALRNGLIDELGGLDKAIAYAADKAGLKPGAYQVRVVNKKVGFMQSFLKALSGDNDEAALQVDVPPALKSSLSALELGGWLSAVRTLNPAQAQVLQRQLQCVRMLQQNKVMLMMPFEITVK